MAETNAQAAQAKIDVSKELFDIAVAKGILAEDNRAGFDTFEKAAIEHIYKRLGLTDVPDQYKTFSQMCEAFAATLMERVEKDMENMNLRRRLAMIGLAKTITKKGDSEGDEVAAPEAGEPVK